MRETLHICNSLIFKQDNSTILDDTTTITAAVTSKHDALDKPMAVKRGWRQTVHVESPSLSAFTYAIAYKGRSDSVSTNTATLTPTVVTVSRLSVGFNQKWSKLRHTITDAATSGSRNSYIEVINESYMLRDPAP